MAYDNDFDDDFEYAEFKTRMERDQKHMQRYMAENMYVRRQHIIQDETDRTLKEIGVDPQDFSQATIDPQDDERAVRKGTRKAVLKQVQKMRDPRTGRFIKAQPANQKAQGRPVQQQPAASGRTKREPPKGSDDALDLMIDDIFLKDPMFDI